MIDSCRLAVKTQSVWLFVSWEKFRSIYEHWEVGLFCSWQVFWNSLLHVCYC